MAQHQYGIIPAIVGVYCDKASNGNVKLYNVAPSVSDPLGLWKVLAHCKPCNVTCQLVPDQSTGIVNDWGYLYNFAEQHAHPTYQTYVSNSTFYYQGDESIGSWNMGNFILGGGPTLTADVIKQIAKLSDFNVDLQARVIRDHYEYSALCSYCGVRVLISHETFKTEVQRLGTDEPNSIKEFCQQHRHGSTDYMLIQVESVGRKFRDG